MQPCVLPAKRRFSLVGDAGFEPATPPCKLGSGFLGVFCPVRESGLGKRHRGSASVRESGSVLLFPAPVAARLQHALEVLRVREGIG